MYAIKRRAMAATEARAVWQRTANRHFIQEHAKTAPKLPLLSKVDTKPANVTDVNDSFALLNDDALLSFHDYMFQRDLTSEQVNVLKARNSHQFVEIQDGNSVNSMSKQSYEFVEMDSVDLPWWQLGEKDYYFDSFVSKKSHSFIENSDFPKPINTNSKSNPQMIKFENSISQIEVQNVDSNPIREIDSKKSKILEALCHSQTRAREAEYAAKEAYAEKEHVTKVLLRQASQLFAYRQWIYLLQLENLCYQMKNNTKSGKLHRNLKKMTRVTGKRKRTKRWVQRYEHDIGRYAVVFVVGLGIVGAGLILGWTVGWLLI